MQFSTAGLFYLSITRPFLSGLAAGLLDVAANANFWEVVFGSNMVLARSVQKNQVCKLEIYGFNFDLLRW